MRMIFKKIPVFLSVLASSLLLSALPAQAGRLVNWGYNTQQNQLEFTTDEGVQPRAQLVTNPSRLVIDLPGTKFGRKQLIQAISNTPGVKSLRVGQFDPQTARLVIELESGYTIDPNQVKFEGLSPRQWRVTLPPITQQASTGDSTTGVDVPSPSGGFTPPIYTPPPVYTPPTQVQGRTQVQGFQVTGDGFFIRTTGDKPQIQVTKSFDRRQVYIDLLGTTLAANARPRDSVVNQRGVSRAILSQYRPNPPATRLTLNVAPDGNEWQASSTPDGSGVIVIPKLSAADPGSVPSNGQLNQVQSVEVEGDRQLVIRTSGRLTYTGNWDRSSGGYRIVLPSSQLASNVRGPKLTSTSPLLQVRLRQEDPQTVSVIVFPAANIQLGELNQAGPQSVILQLRRTGLQPVNPGTSIPIPRPFPTQIPRVPNGRQIVVIDPGHGGPDPGAIGIGGIHEAEIVLDISNQVSSILQQQGISTILTRTGEYDFDLAPRVQIAESNRATVFVSIHANSINLSRPDVNGLETYYFDSGADLARIIHNNVLQSTGMRDRGVRTARFYVLRNTSMPSVLVETGFVTGDEDARNFNNPGFRRQMAEGIARGILQYLRGGG